MPNSANSTRTYASHKSRKLNSWLKNRFPDTTEITLGLRTIFIIPTMTTVALSLTVMLLFLMGINFQNSLIFGLSFWLLALIVISIFFTYRNLSGLSVKSIQASPCFAGEKAVFELQLSCPSDQNKSSIFIGWKDEDLAEVNLHQEESSQHNNPHTQRIKLSHSTSQRGYFKAPRLSIFSRYPIGLIISWSYAALDIQSIVFPEPILQKNADNGIGKDDQAEQGKDIANGSTDFSGIREYQTGDSPKQIHWGTYAKTGELHTKSFIDYASNDLWLEWSNLKLQGVEPKLSHLSARVLECHQLQLIYGLKLPTTTLQPNNGEAHKIACLTALALYGLDSKQRN